MINFITKYFKKYQISILDKSIAYCFYNNTASDRFGVIFGFNEFKDIPNWGSDMGIVIGGYAENSAKRYEKTIINSAIHPFKVGGFSIGFPEEHHDFYAKSYIEYTERTPKRGLNVKQIIPMEDPSYTPEWRGSIKISYLHTDIDISGDSYYKFAVKANSYIVILVYPILETKTVNWFQYKKHKL